MAAVCGGRRAILLIIRACSLRLPVPTQRLKHILEFCCASGKNTLRWALMGSRPDPINLADEREQASVELIRLEVRAQLRGMVVAQM
jgi:hypothetical protein